MRFAAFFTAVVSVTTVRAAISLPSLKNPGDQKLTVQLDQAPPAGIVNPLTPPPDFLPEYNPWAGGVIAKPPGAVTTGPTALFYNYVSAKLTVPNAFVPAGQKPGTPYGVAAWIGIDGYTTPALVQCGIYMNIDALGKLDIKAYYGWIPKFPQTQPLNTPFPIHVGDVLSLRIETFAHGAVAVITIENITAKQPPFSITVEADPASTLSGKSVEWIVERYTDVPTGGYSVPPDATFFFTDAVAKSSDGKAFGPQDGIVINHAPKLLPRVDPGKVTVYYYGA